MSYARMSEMQNILAAEVSDLLADAERIDQGRGRDVRRGQQGPRAA